MNTDNKEHAMKCIDTLFDKDRTENWGHFGRIEFGTKSPLQKMSNFALPLVILTWQRMWLEHFQDNSDETFFVLENYCTRGKKHAAAPLDNLYLGTKDAIKKGGEKQVLFWLLWDKGGIVYCSMGRLHFPTRR